MILSLTISLTLAAVLPAGAASETKRIEEAVEKGIRLLLGMQEGDGPSEWPYEGVYRVKGKIPIGYRVGGTAICATALLQAPGYADDVRRREAVRRAAAFVARAIDDPLMSPQYEGGYDVRVWGYGYGLSFLLRLKRLDLLPSGLEDEAERATRFYLDGLHRTEIPRVGGWAYARGNGLDAVSPPSPFMTAPCLQTLFEARALGYPVDDGVVERGLAVLESSRTETGAVVYSLTQGARPGRDAVPGAVGRMALAEATLHLAGRSNPASVRGAIDAFVAHWKWLDARRAKSGTHERPYGIAPYYFYFAHYYAGQAIELLPEGDRPEYRQRLRDLLFVNRLEDGSWNDRVFPRSANFGTAMSMLCLLLPDLPAPSRWDPVAAKGAAAK